LGLITTESFELSTMCCKFIKSIPTVLEKFKPLLIVPVVLCLALIFAFSDSGTIMDIDNLTTEEADTLKSERPAYKPPEEIFIIVEEMPEYPGGEDALYDYIYSAIEYPADALENKISGQVIVRFSITKKGDISQATVVKGVDESLDAEAIRIVAKMPKWTPGRQAGRPVNVWWVVRIQFQLPNDVPK
jgi:periplasmic protein TonB